MAKTALYRMPHRRRREQKTDYGVRLKLVKSGAVRATIRKSASHTIVQFVKWENKGDRTLLTVTSAQLAKFGWSAGTGNIPAAYLTGLLAARLAKAVGIDNIIADFGMQTSTKGGRLYAVIKGLADGGMSLPYDKAMLPDEKRIGGSHIAAWASAAAKPAFTAYKVRAADLQKHFAEVKARIEKE